MIHSAAAGNYIHRTWGQFPTNTGDWTVFFRFKYTNTPGTDGAEILDIVNIDDTKYLFVGSDHSTSNFFAEISNGTALIDSATVAITLNAQNWFAVTYNATTKIPQFYLNGSILANTGSSTCDMSAVTFTEMFLVSDVIGIGSGDVSGGYCRGWNRLLSSSELTAEAASINAVSSTSLIWDNPLQTSVDLTAHNNTLNHFVAVGTITTDTTDPLISVIAGPPLNITPGTATDVTADSAIFQNTLVSGSAATFTWYKRTCTVSTTWGAIAFGDLATFKPKIDVFEGLANALVNNPYLSIVNTSNLPLVFPVNAGNDYYFRSTRNAAVSPAIVIISILDSLDLPVPIGSIAVNSDAEDFPLALLDANTGYPIKYINPFPAGEAGNILSNGTLLVVNLANTNLKLYSADLSSSTSVAILTDSLTRTSSNNIDTFLVAISGGNQRLVSSAGVINSTIFGPSIFAAWAVGLNVDASKSYYAETNSANVPIKTWNLLTNAAGTNLVAGVAGFRTNPDIVVLQDGTILVPRVDVISIPGNFTITRYNAAGAVQNSINLGNTANLSNHLATDVSDLNFWAWIQGRGATSDPGFNYFKKIVASSGALLIETPAVPQYEGGLYNPSVAINTPIRFGAPQSCPFWITRTVIGPEVNARSGLYNLSGTGSTTRLFHDRVWVDASIGTTENLSIPNPFTESYLAGDE